jgi:xanthine dehydrogenase iron-sulfur cluster and FAD-binding subunit A
MSKQAMRVTVNGKSYARVIEARLTLADSLRHELNLTGTHLGCEHGVCGACTVLIDGRSVRSCLMFAVQANGCEVTTVEGLAPDGKLNVLQQAFIERAGGARGPHRQPVPLHRLFRHRGGGARCRATPAQRSRGLKRWARNISARA